MNARSQALGGNFAGRSHSEDAGPNNVRQFPALAGRPAREGLAGRRDALEKP